MFQVKSTVEQEREEFMRHKEMFRTDQDPARRIVHQKRKYSVSQASVDSVTDTQMILRHKTDTTYISLVNILCFQNPEEWKYVERLIAQAKPKSTPVPEVR